MAKTWKQKFENGRSPVVEISVRSMMGIGAGARMLIPTPRTVSEFVNRIPAGKSMTIPELRLEMAKAFDAEVTCPLTTGIFLRIVAECALEDLAAGTPPDQVTPFWRAIGPKDGVAKKLSCGPQHLVELRAAEGI